MINSIQQDDEEIKIVIERTKTKPIAVLEGTTGSTLYARGRVPRNPVYQISQVLDEGRSAFPQNQNRLNVHLPTLRSPSPGKKQP